MTRTEQLAALDAEVARRRARVGELEADARKRSRAPQRALDELAAYERGVEAGTIEPDEDRHRELTAAVTAAHGPRIELRPVYGTAPDGSQRMVQLEAADRVALDRAQGAREGLSSAEQEAQAFVVEHLAELLAEQAPAAAAARDRFVAALRELADAEAVWSRAIGVADRLGSRSGVFTHERLPDGLPREAAQAVGMLARAGTANPDALLPLPLDLAAVPS